MMTRPDDAGALRAAARRHLAEVESILRDEGTPAAHAALAAWQAGMALQEQYTRHLSHDLRNAMTSISGQTQLLERHLNRNQVDPARMRQTLARVAEATEQATTVARRLVE